MQSATECTVQLIALINENPKFKDKVITASSVDGLVAKLKNAKKPAAGILYEGARPAPSDGGRQIGVSCEMVFSVVLVMEENIINPVKMDTTEEAHVHLDSFFNLISGKRSKTGHFWKWAIEAPVTQKAGNSLWVQRWSTIINRAPTGVVG